MPERERPRATYGRDAFDEIFEVLGKRTDAEKAEFLGVAESTYSRTRRRCIRPGEDFIAATMHAVAHEPRLNGHPSATFERLFPIVEAVSV